MQGDFPSQSRGGHRRSDAEEADRKDAGREKEKSVLSSGIFSSKSHRKTVNPAHKSLKNLFKSKPRYPKKLSVVNLIFLYRHESMDSIPSTASNSSVVEEILRPSLIPSDSILECYCGQDSCPHCNLPY